ncbi:cupin domain-containing protein [uncultured Tateyamaria sp.]|uniref:cupin domain-containing protein n=1 Tax=uncultured Tateyamaria sp. TaxID=455651 RepID=UPI00262EFEB4|nr:cupin domain-containing protein [uncultured Tateyamaria sp.]
MTFTLFRDTAVPRVQKDTGNATLSGDPVQHAELKFAGHNDTIKSGIWDCTAGAFRADYDGITEFCHVLEGGATITTDTGETYEVAQGDAFVMAAGLRTTWTVPHYIKKHFVICAVD